MKNMTTNKRKLRSFLWRINIKVLKAEKDYSKSRVSFRAQTFWSDKHKQLTKFQCSSGK